MKKFGTEYYIYIYSLLALETTLWTELDLRLAWKIAIPVFCLFMVIARHLFPDSRNKNK